MHNYPNYGSVLQAYATQEKLKEYFSDVEIIDYAGGYSTVGRSLPAFIAAGFESGSNMSASSIIKNIARLPLRLWRRAVFGGFANKHMNLTKRYETDADLTNFPVHDGFYCTGSDQVWNPFFLENMPFFLNFIPEGKNKFGYAVSFGNYIEERLRSEETERIKKYIGQYARISVREERGLGILQNQIGYPGAVRLVDPTLAMPAEFWRRLAPASAINYEYILLYQLGKEKSIEALARAVSERTRLPVVRLYNHNLHHIFNNSNKKIVLPPVFQFITLIDKAQYVITDSFHGTAFAMMLNTPPVVCREAYDGGRISEFLRLLGQESRYVKDHSDAGIIDRPVDFSLANKILSNERDKVDEYLRGLFL